MAVRLIFVVLLFSIAVINIHASTITFLHKENIEVKIRDAVYPKILEYAPKFMYPTSTVYQFAESDFHFYSLSINSEEYLFWVDESFQSMEIDLSDLEINSSKVILISKDNWLSGTLSINNERLKKLHQADLFYSNALDSLIDLAETDDQFKGENNFNTVVWDTQSSRRLYNLAVEKFNFQVDEKWVLYSPFYAKYWQFMYELYYQYYHTNSFKGKSKTEIKSIIMEEFNYPESRLLVFHHFFREGLILNELKENYELFKADLGVREENLVEAFIQNQAVKDLSNKQKIDFLFGLDIDGAMEGYFARDSTEKKNVIVFWSTWNGNIATEFNLLAELKQDYKKKYSFIHICIDAYETPDKTKSFIYQNRVGGFHLLPEQSNAFRKSNFRKDLKIRDFPFYVLTDNSGKVIITESVPLQISNRLESKLKYFSTKK